MVDMWEGPLGVLGPLEEGEGCVIFGGWYDASAEGSLFGGR